MHFIMYWFTVPFSCSMDKSKYDAKQYIKVTSNTKRLDFLRRCRCFVRNHDFVCVPCVMSSISRGILLDWEVG